MNSKVIEIAVPLLGMLLGVIFAILSLTYERENELVQANAVAKVNDKYISKEKYQSYIDSYARDKKAVITIEDRRHVLDRMIDEELLIQQSLEYGMMDSNKNIRSSVVTAMISLIKERSKTNFPSDEDLLEFYSSNINYFTKSDYLHIKKVVIF